MRRNDRSKPGRSAGFSLLEMVVAIAILGLAMGALYQAAGGATRNVRTDENYAYGVELARSVLANYGRVPLSGVNERGETAGGFRWEVRTRPIQMPRETLPEGSLHEIEVAVRWDDGRRDGQFLLHSVVEGIRQ